MRLKSPLFYKLDGRYTFLSSQHTSAAFFTGWNWIFREIVVTIIYTIPLLFIHYALPQQPDFSLYPRGLATYRPNDGLYIAFSPRISNTTVWGIVLFCPVLSCFAILHFRHFGNIYTIFNHITRNKKAIYPANSKRVKWSKKINVQIPDRPSYF
jgi:hypothetical protein